MGVFAAIAQLATAYAGADTQPTAAPAIAACRIVTQQSEVYRLDKGLVRTNAVGPTKVFASSTAAKCQTTDQSALSCVVDGVLIAKITHPKRPDRVIVATGTERVEFRVTNEGDLSCGAKADFGKERAL